MHLNNTTPRLQPSLYFAATPAPSTPSPAPAPGPAPASASVNGAPQTPPQPKWHTRAYNRMRNTASSIGTSLQNLGSNISSGVVKGGKFIGKVALVGGLLVGAGAAINWGIHYKPSSPFTAPEDPHHPEHGPGTEAGPGTEGPHGGGTHGKESPLQKAENKLVLYYYHKAALIQKHLVAAKKSINDNVSVFETRKELIQLIAKLEKAAQGLQKAGVDEEFLASGHTPTPEQIEALQRFLSASQNALYSQSLDFAAVQMSLKGKPDPRGALIEDLKELKEEEGTKAADTFLNLAIEHQGLFESIWGVDPQAANNERFQGQ